MAGLSRPFCDKLFFAIPMSVPIEIIPDDAGLILADAYGVLRRLAQNLGDVKLGARATSFS